MDSSFSSERRNLVSAHVPSYFKRSLQTTEVHHVNVRHLQINPKSSSSVERIVSVIPTFPYEKHILLFGMQQFAVVKAGYHYLNGNPTDRTALMHTPSVDSVLWRPVKCGRRIAPSVSSERSPLRNEEQWVL